VIDLATRGLTDKEICAELGVKMTTVRTHWLRVRAKLGVVNRGQAIAKVGEMAHTKQARCLTARAEGLQVLLNAHGMGVIEFRQGCEPVMDEAACELLNSESPFESLSTADRAKAEDWITKAYENKVSPILVRASGQALQLSAHAVTSGGETSLLCVVSPAKNLAGTA